MHQRLAREYVVNKSIRLWVHADGIVAFDFSRWGPGKRIVDRDKDERELEDVFLRTGGSLSGFTLDEAEERLHRSIPEVRP